jgi:hypothetical protein
LQFADDFQLAFWQYFGFEFFDAKRLARFAAVARLSPVSMTTRMP